MTTTTRRKPTLCATDPGAPIRALRIYWSTPGRRYYPHDVTLNVAESTGWQRHTMRATYRTLRALHEPWQARAAIVRLVNLGDGATTVASRAPHT